MQVLTFSKAKEGGKQLTAHFAVSEFACNDGSDAVLIDVDGVAKLEQVRTLLKKPLILTSAYRTSAYNRAVGGSSQSYHVKGRAFDTYVSGVSLSLLSKAYEAAGFTGLIIYPSQGFIHVDTRTSRYLAYNDGTKISSTLSVLSQGSNGQDAKDVQTMLNLVGGGTLSVDGAYGPMTAKAVSDYQSAKGLGVDGVCGPQTWRSLLTP